MNHLWQQVMLRLEADWPQSLWQWDNQEAEIRTMWLNWAKRHGHGMDISYLDDYLPGPISTIALVGDYDIPSLLPSSFYHLSCLSINDDRCIHWWMGEIVIIWKASYMDGAPLTGGCYLQQITCACSRGGLGLHAHLRAFSAPPRLATVTQMTLALWYHRSACWCKYVKHANRHLILWSLHIITWNKIVLVTRPAPCVVAIFRRSL